jgi:hypothetical protein
MDIISLRNSYSGIWFSSTKFMVDDLSSLNTNNKILSDLSKKFGFNFIEIDPNLYMYISDDNYHIIRVNNDGSYDYTMFTRIERHDDSCTYVRNINHYHLYC